MTELALKDLADCSPLDGDWEYVLRIPLRPSAPASCVLTCGPCSAASRP